MFNQKGSSNFTKFKKRYKPDAMKGFSGFDGRTIRQAVVPPDPLPVEEFAPDIGSDKERRLANDLKDADLAHRVIVLQEKHPYSTVIEMLVMDWLDKNLAEYVYQARVNGGYRPGGTVPDFAVKNANKEWYAILVNGNYWHQVAGSQNDTTDKLQLVGSPYRGSRIAKAMIVWESRLMRGKQARDEAMLAVMQGLELGT